MSNEAVKPVHPTEALYAKYGASVLRRARAMLGDEQLARDATQEVFLKVLRSFGEFRAEASPITYLYRATTNHCLNVLRDHDRRGGVPDPVDPETVGTTEGGGDVTLDDRLTLSAVLARVPEGLREVAVYFYLDQMSHDEIAQVTGVSRRTVGNRLVEFHQAAKQVVRRSECGAFHQAGTR